MLYAPPLWNRSKLGIFEFIRKQCGGGGELLALFGGAGFQEGVEFGVGLAADGAHGGAFGVLGVLFGLDFGFDGFEVDKPGFEDGLGDVFEGLVDLAVEFDFVVNSYSISHAIYFATSKVATVLLTF